MIDAATHRATGTVEGCTTDTQMRWLYVAWVREGGAHLARCVTRGFETYILSPALPSTVADASANNLE